MLLQFPTVATLYLTPTMFATGDTVWLSSTMMADSYTWSTSDTTPTIAVTASGTYTLDIADACGSGSEGITISFIDGPTASFTETTSFLTCAFTNTSTSGGGTNTYSWDFGDGSTSTDESPTHIYGADGVYTVTLIVTNECGSDTTTGTCTVTTVGMEEDALNQSLSIYPNPTSGNFTVTFTASSSMNVELTVLDLQGQVIYNNALGSVSGDVKEAINLNDIAAGMYFVELKVNDSKITRKLIVE